MDTDCMITGKGWQLLPAGRAAPRAAPSRSTLASSTCDSTDVRAVNVLVSTGTVRLDAVRES
jgi:hypothetical protein